ncbi:plasmolipin [Hyla sarda]|uniref:plasmolipin n=1 Tax=Hyla sarda TaxID=327740 RepID=UPI0024C34964|nr:plasmolipin [Hyla sarda]XP_056381581.1 plasmolipin [Hyla sarda]XP_056381582.1 plasmolipin [Hyla sarda]XP_056381583.1 plasmolipin [Hyla sarda]XP_056381584.1 plasmolipin [Hyla sarda]XP_056381586.1 plasmolipin [Hyla sarda]XP_056381587.1 plasmolipin [Hyla sarda]
MTEFPAKVSTQTSTPEASSGIGRFCPKPDITFLMSIPGILMMVEIVLGLLVWALIADAHYYAVAAYGWVMFVAVFCWVLTLILFIMILLQLQRRIPVVPWPLTVFIYHALCTALYITGFITCAASVHVGSRGTGDYNRRAAASFFACLVMIAYGGSTFFSFGEWRGTQSNAASAQA